VYASGTAENHTRPNRAFGAMLPRMHLQLRASAVHVAFHLQIAEFKPFDSAWLSKHFSACPQLARLGLREPRNDRFNRVGGPVKRVGTLPTKPKNHDRLVGDRLCAVKRPGKRSDIHPL
jgi:hypothetical protein